MQYRWFLKSTQVSCASKQSIRQQLLFIEDVCTAFFLSHIYCHFIFKKSILVLDGISGLHIVQNILVPGRVHQSIQTLHRLFYTASCGSYCQNCFIIHSCQGNQNVVKVMQGFCQGFQLGDKHHTCKHSCQHSNTFIRNFVQHTTMSDQWTKKYPYNILNRQMKNFVHIWRCFFSNSVEIEMFLYLHLRYGVGLWMQVANQKEFVHKGENEEVYKKGGFYKFHQFNSEQNYKPQKWAKYQSLIKYILPNPCNNSQRI